MKHLLVILSMMGLFGAPVRAADSVSGTWMTTSGASVQTFVFKVKQDAITGLSCVQCDSPASVFRIEDGKVIDANRIMFFIRYDRSGPAFDKLGPYRDRVEATMTGDQLTLRAQPDRGGSPVTTVLRRVVENGVSMAKKTWTLATSNPPLARASSSPLDGKWVANGRVAQQNFVLKVEDGGKVWGLVCGPCDADGVFMIDDGTIAGDQITFYINHIDTPPSPRPGLRRNIMRGTILGNVMKFKWVREGAEDQPGGEMVLIGPIR